MLIYLKIWIRYGIKPPNIKQHIYQSLIISIPSLIKKIKNKKIIINNFHDLIFMLYKDYADKKKNTLFGEKEANFHYKPLKKYQNTLNNIKIIYIIRDSRYVFSSLKKVWFGTKNPYLFSKLWNQHIANLKEFKNKRNLLVIRYEDLSTKNLQIKKKIMNFLKIENSKKNRNKSLAKTISKLYTHKKLNNSSFNNKNFLDISEIEKKIIEKITGKNLRYFGYKVSKSRMSIKDKIFYLLTFDLSKNSIARLLFSFLPLFLKIFSTFRVSQTFLTRILKIS